MPTLITTDTHFSDHPRDAHRFDLFPWLLKQADKHKVDKIMFLGDLTEDKDRHSSVLVNTVAQALVRLSRDRQVVILRGNHDCIDASNPFFGFMGLYPNIIYVDEYLDYLQPKKPSSVFLAHSRNPEDHWTEINFELYDYVFVHQTFDGAAAENGQQLSGISTSRVKGIKRQVFSGDIHVPQTIGKVTYVGAPYHIRFGDSFEPRVILLDEETGKTQDLHFPTKAKHLIEVKCAADLDDLDGVEVGDQVKIRVMLAREELVGYDALRREIKAYAEKLGLEVYGVSAAIAEPEKGVKRKVNTQAMKPGAVLGLYAKREQLATEVAEEGVALLKKHGPGA